MIVPDGAFNGKVFCLHREEEKRLKKFGNLETDGDSAK
jgi:hypothetical protein